MQNKIRLTQIGVQSGPQAKDQSLVSTTAL